MTFRTLAACGLLMGALALPAIPCWSRPDAPVAPARARVAEAIRRMDVNRVNLLVANDGRFPYDPADGTSGALYPRSSAASLLYASGLWLGGTVGGLARVTVAEYESEFAPGGMPGGVPDDPSAPQHVVYKVARWSGDPRDTAHVVRTASELAADPELDPLAHHSWSEYMAGAAPHGAPWRMHRLPDTSTPAAGDSVNVPGPDVLGDRMLWCVFNDADVTRHVAAPGATEPLGVEVRQAVFAYDRPGPLGNAVFVRYEVLNRGANTVPDLRMAFWSDPDIGLDDHDDLAGCDTVRSLAIAYNTPWGADPALGWAKPAVGFDLLASDFWLDPPGPQRFSAFIEYVNGADPASAAESWNLMCGLHRDGTPFTDPYFQVTTPYFHAGDPVLRSYGFDPQPSNEKVLATAGPRAFAPGDTAVLWVALLVGQGASPAASLEALRCASDDAQDAFDAGFAEPFAAPRDCGSAVNDCPRGADWWAENSAALTQFTASQWSAIAAWADSLSAGLFTFPGLGSYASILATRHGTARDSARREYLAVLSNVVAGEVLGLVPADGTPARLSRRTGVQATPLAGGTVGELLGWAPVVRELVEARYEDDVPAHRRALEGVPVGLPRFGGGAGPAAFGMGSTLDPLVSPDSFPTVLLRFGAGAGQQAYRYLRLETALGAEPAGGRAYRYSGHRFVPLTAWDLRSGLQLELAFAERAVTLDDGTLVPTWSQPPSFDSTWAPTPAADGGLERLWVLARPYRATPSVQFAADGVPLAGAWPALYQLDARKREVLDVVDDGDGFRFVAGWPATPSAEGLLHALESASPADSEVAVLHSGVAAGLRDVNLGYGFGPVCVRAAPFDVTLVEAAALNGHVRLRWRLGEPTGSARLERRNSWGVWLDGGAASPEPGGTVLAEFDEPEGGRRAYRLAFATATGFARSDSVWIDPPAGPALAVTGVWPNPSDGAARVSFTLPSGGATKLEVYDLGGRRAHERDLGALAAGLHHVEIAPARRLRPGVYFVVLRFGGERRTARFVAL